MEDIFKIPPFRGLDKFDKWCYGVPTEDIFSDGETVNIEEMRNSGMFPVLRKTVSLAIFAADKKKDQIYSGDIVTIRATDGIYKGVVTYIRNACAWAVVIGKKAVLFSDLTSGKDENGIIYFKNVEIVDNIHLKKESEAADDDKERVC